MTHAEKTTLADGALDAACLHIQDALGVTDGGLAGAVFSDDRATDMFREYIDAEISMAAEDAIECQSDFLPRQQRS